jgi:phosphoglycerate kinase
VRRRISAETALEIMDKAKAANCEILLPVDVVVARRSRPARTARWWCQRLSRRPDDPGRRPRSRSRYTEGGGEAARTLVWNGPLGAFEIKPFDGGTVALARTVADQTAAGKLLSVAGGGDTVAALAAAGVEEKLSYVSTAGGAFLEWMEGKTLPGVAALIRAA